MAFAALGCVASAAPASAATQFGANFAANNGNCGDVNTALQTSSPGNSYAAPMDGVVTSWTFQSDVFDSMLGTIRLVVARAAGGASYTTVGQSPPHTPIENVPNTYADVRIPVRAGDILGYFSITADDITNCSRTGQPGFETRFVSGSVEPGSTASYNPPIPGRELNLSAALEPDADNDGFGDETQDACPSDPATQGPCPDTAAPDTTITGQPKAKTKKKAATFTFTSSEPGSSFECSLNGVPFTTCTSPLTVKGKKGKNHFEARAKDAAGNVDATPATFDWKAKKKKKK